jgi:RNA polymerase sigma factor (sigma-70 family)
MEELTKDLSRLADEEINKALLTRYQEDASAFDTIYERFHRELFVFIKRHLEGALRSETEDILQETFVALHNMRDRLQPNTKLRGLLYRIAERRLTDAIRAATAGKRHSNKTVHFSGGSHLNVSLDHRAMRNRTEGSFLANGLDGHQDGRAGGINSNYYGAGGWGIEHISDPKADPAVRDAKLEVDEMLTTLPPTEEQAVRLVELDGHTHASAAALANVPESTIWARVRSGRRRLKALATSSGCVVTAGQRHTAATCR